MSDDCNALLGRTFKQTYLLEAHVETGGMAFLFRARHLSLDTPVALKILQPHLTRQASMKRRFLQEARLQFQLHHPHIIRALDVVDEDDWLGMVMEWIDGCDLQALLQGHEGPLPVGWVWAIAAPVIEALLYAHSAKDAWVHRDIKPSNIMLAAVEGRIVPKLGDFGIARALSGEGAGTETGAALGSMMYMAPEQLRDASRIDQRADIYGLGAVLFYLLTGKPPFVGSAEGLMFQHLYAPPPDPLAAAPTLAPALAQLVLRCLQKRPEQRFANMQALKDAFHDAMTEVVGASAPPALPVTLLSDAWSQGEGEPDSAPLASAATPRDLPPGHTSPGSSASHPAPPATGGEAPIREASADGAARSSSGPLSWPWVVAVALLLVLGGAWIVWQPGAQPDATRATVADGSGVAGERSPDVASLTTGCQEGSVRRCFGSRATKARLVIRGLCKAGQQRCHKGRFGPCVGAIVPRAEVCNDKDDDCDGQIDEDFPRKGRRCQARAGLCAVAGRWRCQRQGQLGCVADRSRPATAGARQVRLHIRPRGVTFGLTLGRHRIRARRWTCLPLAGRGTLTIEAPGFQRCIVPLEHVSQRLWLRLKKRSLLAEEPPYCLRRRAVGGGGQ